MFDNLDNFIMPRPNQKEWWQGDANTLPLFDNKSNDSALFVVEDFISKAQCETLIECYNRNRDKYAEKTGDTFWDGRYIQFHDIMAHEHETARIMQQIRHIASMYILNEFVSDEPIYPDTAQLVGWSEGMDMKPHADNIEPDGGPNISSHRNFSSIIYLNDDYEGGQTYFPSLGVRVAPKAGTLVLFGAGYEFVHGVTKITKGKRYIYSGWFTTDKDWIDVSSVKVI
ncbi:MAG: 2OG-Fe(II) oxygenase [Caulobacterales bacterium]|nr:2OG-Fe(II) oxygenase [Caulobacterales bacterium]